MVPEKEKDREKKLPKITSYKDGRFPLGYLMAK